MYPIHHVLVAIKDPRAVSHPALGKAAAIAAALDAKLQLFHSIDTVAYPDAPFANFKDPPRLQTEDEFRNARQQALESLAAPLRRQGLTVTTAVEWDSPRHEAIIRAAAGFGASLIVAGDHARRHPAPWLVRYTGWQLVRMSPVPVLLVKTPKPYRKPVILAAVDPRREFAKPASLDGEILRFSCTLSDALQGQVHAMHGYVPVPPNPPEDVLSTPGKLQKTLARAQQAAFESILDATRSFGIKRNRLHVIGRHPTDAILESAADLHSQIVAIGSVSRKGVGRFLIGNTAESLLDRLDCDVLIVKPAEFPHQVPRARRGPRVIPLPLSAG